MNILITGIHGFVGSNLIAALKAKHILYGLDIVSPQTDGVIKTFKWNELNDIPPIDCIIHLAGKAHDTKNQTNAQVYFEINTVLTKKIFDWFLTTTATKFIFFSSVKAVADKVEGQYLNEDAKANPLTPYGRSKLQAEQYILDQPLSETKKVYILRPCMIHGPGNKGNLNLLYKIVKKGFPWPLGAFSNQRSFLSIDNLTFIIKQIIDNKITPGTYQLADDMPLSTNHLVELIAESLGKKPNVWHINKSLVEFLAKLGDTLHLPLNSERLQKLTENYVVGNQKIKNALDIDKMPVGGVSGMKKTLQSFNFTK